MKRHRFFVTGMVASVLALTGLAAATPVGYANTADFPNPLPPQVVLNQTNVDGVPMVSNADPNAPQISSDAAVVMDMSTGTIVYAKNPNTSHYPASITKIMTAVIALQRGHLDDVLTASPYAVEQEPDKLYLVPGETEPLGKLLYGLLLISANDAAVVIAEHYGGSVSGFANMMNGEAHQLGAQHTHFANPNGLPNPDHVTTAYDMSLIARAAMQYPEFRSIVDTRSYHWQGEKWQSELTNLNKMLYYYPGAIGLKTGFTSVAHNTLVVAATRNGQTFLAVLLDAQSNVDIRHDASKIMDYAFSHYHTQPILTKGTVVTNVVTTPGIRIPVVTDADLMATSPLNQDVSIHTKVTMDAITRDLPKGTKVGALQVEENGRKITTVPLVLTAPLSLPKQDSEDSGSFTFVYWFVGGLCLLMIGISLFWVKRRKQLNFEGSDWSTPSA
jgi:serine-type D-Ala-D-Ala carboxypeptidase (penicillin-binding protein 5/6)